MTTTAPAQHMKALAQANKVRAHVAALRRDLATGELMFRDLDLDDPMLQGIRVSLLLRGLPWWNQGRKTRPYCRQGVKADRLLAQFGASDRTRVGSLSAVRKRELKRLVAEKCPSQRRGSES